MVGPSVSVTIIVSQSTLKLYHLRGSSLRKCKEHGHWSSVALNWNRIPILDGTLTSGVTVDR